jgi:hypothetical protein
MISIMLNNLLKWMRSFGTAGNFIANAVQFLLISYPGLTIGAIGVWIVNYYTSILLWVQQPAIYSSMGVFLFILWTYIALTLIKDRREIKAVRIAHDYAYAIIVEGGWQAIFGKFPSNHPIHPNSDAFNLSCNFRNVSAGPLRLKVEEMRAIINSRTCEESPSIELIFARMGPKLVRSGAIPRDKNERNLSGSVHFKFIYGHPDGRFVRRYTLKMKVHIILDPVNNTAVVTDEIIEEKDEPI